MNIDSESRKKDLDFNNPNFCLDKNEFTKYFESIGLFGKYVNYDEVAKKVDHKEITNSKLKMIKKVTEIDIKTNTSDTQSFSGLSIVFAILIAYFAIVTSVISVNKLFIMIILATFLVVALLIFISIIVNSKKNIKEVIRTQRILIFITYIESLTSNIPVPVVKPLKK